MKGKKLPPDVWIVFNRLGEIPDIQIDKAKAQVLFPKSESLHRYTPAKPAKTCLLSHVQMSEAIDDYSVTQCGKDSRNNNDWKFCPYCGGKIKVKR